VAMVELPGQWNRKGVDGDPRMMLPTLKEREHGKGDIKAQEVLENDAARHICGIGPAGLDLGVGCRCDGFSSCCWECNFGLGDPTGLDLLVACKCNGEPCTWGWA
jgi:hypothetical protein